MTENGTPPQALLITRNLPPLVGGMERLNWRMAQELAKGAEVRIIGPTGSTPVVSPDVPLEGVPLKPVSRFLVSSAYQAIRLARMWRPSLVLAGSGLTAPIAWLASRACGARSAVYLHGLDIATRHPLYAVAWMPFIRRMDHVIANSDATRALAVGRGVPEERITIVHPGVDLPAASDTASASMAFRAKHRLGQGPILLSVGRLTERKGLREFVDEVLPMVCRARPDVQLVVVGGTAEDALAARSQSPQSILRAAEVHGLASKIHFVGVITDPAALAEAYQAASLHVFPVRKIEGDPEGFGMVAIESAANGVPTAAYATGGTSDSVAEGVSGYLAPAGDAEALAERILRLLDTPLPSDAIRSFAADFAWPRFGERLRKALLPEEAGHGAA